MVKAVTPEGDDEDGNNSEREEARGLLITERRTTTLDLVRRVKEGDDELRGGC